MTDVHIDGYEYDEDEYEEWTEQAQEQADRAEAILDDARWDYASKIVEQQETRWRGLMQAAKDDAIRAAVKRTEVER